MLTLLIVAILTASSSEMTKPAAFLPVSTRQQLEEKAALGTVCPDEVLWLTLDALANNFGLGELSKLEKILDGSPYAEGNDELTYACRKALTVQRGNRSGIIVFELLWLNLGGRELDAIVNKHSDDWRYRLLRGCAYYWTPGQYGKRKTAYQDMKFASQQYGEKYGWDEALTLMWLWQGNLARRDGRLDEARQAWQYLVAQGSSGPYSEQAGLMLAETQSR